MPQLKLISPSDKVEEANYLFSSVFIINYTLRVLPNKIKPRMAIKASTENQLLYPKLIPLWLFKFVLFDINEHK